MEGFQGDPDDIPTIFKLFWFANIPFWSTFYLSKATLLSMYLQIFPDFMRKRRIFLWATIIYVACAYVASVVLLFFICFPISTVWDLDPNRTCPGSVTNTLDRVTWALHFFGDLLDITGARPILHQSGFALHVKAVERRVQLQQPQQVFDVRAAGGATNDRVDKLEESTAGKPARR
ncbi:hypothetical protein AK830_g6216 [Neonectria ditissima]|uniref:Rhodopsin domain-containing protein n=1 Tax=Neonectria ditissima TaxID=78410 RepID=A0A0P7B2M6_9HYPO|nr:hypothetical protein AK830_g6216 [Neonectria ditissima]